MSTGTGKEKIQGGQTTGSPGEGLHRDYTAGAAHVINGGTGGSAGTDITSWPHTLATHTATGAGTTYNLPSGRCTFQATAADNGGDITVGISNIEVSNDNSAWETMGTLNVTTDGTTDGFTSDAPWAYIRSNCTTLTETGSTPQLIITINI